MFSFRCRAMVAVAGVVPLAGVLGGCAAPSRPAPTPPLAVYQPLSHPAKVASRPRTPSQTGSRNAGGAVAAPPLSDAEKTALFQQFDEWQSRRHADGGAASASACCEPAQ